MYLIGKGADVMGPGTATVQRIDWNRDNERQMRATFNPRPRTNKGFGCLGMGCPGMGCGCGSMAGLGLFESMDPSTWGGAEWGIAALGAYAVLSMLFTTKRAVTRARAIPGERRKKRAAALRKKASELTRRK